MSDDEDLFEEAMHTLGTKRTARAAPRPGKALPPGVTVSEDLDFDALMRSDGRGPAPDLSNAKPKAPPIEAAPTAAPLPAAPITTKRYSATPQEIAEFDRAMRELGSPPPDHPDLALALTAREQLEKARVRTRVVSMPCREWFDAQPRSYRDTVLPPTVRARVSVEAGVSQGWREVVGDAGRVVAIDHFGASADAGTLFREFGFTPQAVVAAAKSSLKAARAGAATKEG